MSFIVKPGRNATLSKAWAAHKAAQKVADRAAKPKEKPEVEMAPAKSKNAPPPRGGKKRSK